MDVLKLAKTFNTGENFKIYHFLGCHAKADGFIFRVWAPNAKQVSLIGDFCDWVNGLQMSKTDEGIWEIWTKKAQIGSLYKFLIVGQDGSIVEKSDPVAFQQELRPGTASVVKAIPIKKWGKKEELWLKRKAETNFFQAPINIYEVHAGSFKLHGPELYYLWSELSDELISYVKKMGYTHIEFMPLTEYPLDASWGYQATGYFALTSRYGDLSDFQNFVEKCHENNIGVIMDWVPGHFNKNGDALARFDGTAQYEYNDPLRADNPNWGAYNFDLSKPQVQSFLISSLVYFFETFHLDGVRIDAVSNMLYRDFGGGAWTPNSRGTNENDDGIFFLEKLTHVVRKLFPHNILIAEESTHQIKITRTIDNYGLGFDFKWNMGWMNDILKFYEMDPLYRKDHLNLVTFSFMYNHRENYILPLSHDEVVHGKKSLMHKMWGDRYRQKAQLRNLFTYMLGHPGKKLNFMGNEWGQFLEWRFWSSLEWIDLQDELNQKTLAYTKALNQFYQDNSALWELDHHPSGLEIIDADNTSDTTLSFIRWGIEPADFVIFVFNFTPVERLHFKVGVPFEGTYQEKLNSELEIYGGTWLKGNGKIKSSPQNFKQFDNQIEVTLPAFGALIIVPTQTSKEEHK